MESSKEKKLNYVFFKSSEDLSDDVMVYTSYATGFKSGGFNSTEGMIVTQENTMMKSLLILRLG